MIGSLFVFIGCISSCMCLTAPYWPKFWSANWEFVSEYNPNELLEKGLWYYNVTVTPGLLRQDNDMDCPISAFNKVCRAIFKNNNVYLYNPGDGGLCCQCWKDVPPTPPDWLVRAGAKETSSNTEYKPLNAVCSEWKTNFDSYYANVNNSYPVAEPGGGTTIQWTNISTNANEFNSGVFYTPNDCNKGCNELFPEFYQKTKHLRSKPNGFIRNVEQFHCGM